ncbi:hypothetical protein VTO42DRAFT_342 [Malbranchea cinnamomea]
MSVWTEELAVQGSPRAELVALFSTPTKSYGDDVELPPSKRRKVSNGKVYVFEAENGDKDTLPPGYLTIARYTLKITFQSYPNGHHLTAEASDCYSDGPIAVVAWREDGRLVVSTKRSGVVLDEPFEPKDPLCIDSARRRRLSRPCSPSRSRSVYGSLSTLRRVPGQRPTFQLDVRIFWRDSLVIPSKSANFSLFEQCVPGTRASTASKSRWNPREFYECVHVPEKTLDLPSVAELEKMPSRLFPFQRRTVRWLLEREGVGISPEGKLCPSTPQDGSELPASFQKITDADGRVCYSSHLFRTLSTDLSSLRPYAASQLRGGILAEEMGLGKTLELLTLITLHRRKSSPLQANGTENKDSKTDLIESGATLIVSPPAILEQWKEEIQAHAPDLRCVEYHGLYKSERSDEEILQELVSADVVVTTYPVLEKEVHYTEEPPARAMRYPKKYERRMSPLVKLSWWRVCIDEAQMIESGISGAARVAQVIPRVNAWAVTGTPLRRDMKDIYGLLLFLNYQPISWSVDHWVRLYERFKWLFQSIIGKLVLRHTKALIGDELRLPRQKRIVITVPFTAVEEQNYDQLFQQMCDECGLDLTGAPAVENWNPNSSSTIEKMRLWLSRLRRACLYAGANASGTGKPSWSSGPLWSVDEVLERMIDQNDTKLRTEERALLLSQIRRGQLMENALKPKEALQIWQDALARCELMVQESRDQYKALLSKLRETRGASEVDDHDDDLDETEDGEQVIISKIGQTRQRLRAALELQHMCKFFIASAYYQIKTDPELTKPDSDEFRSLEKLEEDTYEEAKLIRREMLSTTHRRVSRFIDRIRHRVENKGLTKIPEMSIATVDGGIESRRFMERIEEFCEAMNEHARQFTKWRNHMSKLLLESLIDEEDGAELKGDEYESSTKHQDEMYVYMEALRVMFADRNDAITGQTNLLIAHEIRQGLDMAKQGEGPSPQLYMSLMKTCQELKIPQEMGSLRQILSDLRSLAMSLENQEIQGSIRARAELAIVNGILDEVSRMSSAQSKASSALEKEIELFRDVMNKRLEYYRQLQQISDTVAPYKEETRGQPLDASLYGLKEEQENRIEAKIATLKAKRRYLFHLRDESGAESSARMCIICQSSIEIGVLTVCGHKYCKSCLLLWWNQRHNCPTCKNHLGAEDLHQITYKPTDLIVQEENTPHNLEEAHSIRNLIYSDISAGVLQEIKDIVLNSSFGTKIDTLARHILWLRQHDPGAKSIVFSQYKSFLSILERVFEEFNIEFTSVDRPGGIEKFKRNASIECFLLHAKAHSSGLNLVNATHVFLCEPLINTAIELQAIARVHRIGQHRETTVWMYLVSDTVEESIYNLSVSRRLAHIAQKRKEEEQQKQQQRQLLAREDGTATPIIDLTDNVIESANTEELQEATLGNLMAGPATEGERVSDDDLWQCLFGEAKPRASGRRVASEAVQNEVGRLLRADAAEARISQASALDN